MNNTPANNRNARLIAFYLPQFHPIPENDNWWGKGFTEWTNVVKARPLFRGHYQPHVPADLGFYDLRLPEAREAQASLAKEHGIYGFCYYHYWFNGRRLLNRPFDEVLNCGKPDFPFCLCWANERWTRAWDGQSSQILLSQVYSEEDDINHMRWLARVFTDSRYIKIEDKPLFLVYRTGNLPDSLATTDRWREEAHRLGVGSIYLCKVESFPAEQLVEPNVQGFDASVEFQPDWQLLGPPIKPSIISRILFATHQQDNPFAQHRIHEYQEVVARMINKQFPEYRRFPCVTPSWDNSPRRETDSVIFHNSSPELYGKWLDHVILNEVNKTHIEPVVFINAWNEWGEGNHLEPCQKWGSEYLKETNRILMKYSV